MKRMLVFIITFVVCVLSLVFGFIDYNNVLYAISILTGFSVIAQLPEIVPEWLKMRNEKYRVK